MVRGDDGLEAERNRGARRAVAIRGFATVRDRRLTARAFEAWVTCVTVATRHELCVRKMRVVRLAQVALWGWSARVAAGAFRRR